MDSPSRSDSDSSLASDAEQEAILATDNGAKKGQHSKVVQLLTSSKERFIKEDIEVISRWLENPTNFSWVFGTTKQTSFELARKARQVTFWRNLWTREEDKDEFGLEAELQDVLKQRAENQELPIFTQGLELNMELVRNPTVGNKSNSKPSDSADSSIVTKPPILFTTSNTSKRARRFSDTTDTDSSARPPRAKDPRKAPPRLGTGPPPATGENPMATAFQHIANTYHKGENLV
ncbi:hypothetical protein EDD11_008727 [Mortierella claussenii]|nr:hypothetical protein EDD11_008727 [Mortierella claussenii]